MSDEVKELHEGYNIDLILEREPNELVKKTVSRFKPSSNVLDLGCGQGIDSIYLARLNKGFKVTALDKSKSAIERMMLRAECLGVKIKPIITSMEYLREFPVFDIIISMNSLQSLPHEKINQMICWMKSHTKPSGYNLIKSFSAIQMRADKPHPIEYFYGPNEFSLREKYSNWLVEYYNKSWGEWESHGEEKHRHYLIQLIAKNV